MHPAIAEFPATAFYAGLLRSHPTPQDRIPPQGALRSAVRMRSLERDNIQVALSSDVLSPQEGLQGQRHSPMRRLYNQTIKHWSNGCLTSSVVIRI